MAEMGTAVIEESATSIEQEVPEQEAQAEETAAPAPADETEEVAAEVQPSEITAEKGPEPAKEKDLGQKGVAELITTRKRAQAAELEAARLKGQLEAVERFGLKPKEAAAAQPEEIAPNPDSYDLSTQTGLATYLKDANEFNSKQALKQVETAQQRKAAQAQEKAAKAAAQAEYDKFVAAGVSEFGEDFEDTVLNTKGVQISEHMADAIYDSESGHLMAMHLANNPAESARIAALPKAKQMREMISLESKIQAARQPKQTQTPPPVKPLKGGATIVDESSMSDDAWFALEEKRQAEARKGRV